jgi:hypothetical protein
MLSEPFFAPARSSLDYFVRATLGLFTEMTHASQKHPAKTHIRDQGEGA